MKPLVHRYILPPVLLGLHLVLLLPVFLAPPPPGNPDDDHDAVNDQEPLLRRMHPKDAIPLGIVGVVGVHVLKQLAGKIPLPKDPRRTRLAAQIEAAVLFALGAVEELWRWGLVRMLIMIVGGEGGFRGRGELWDLQFGVVGGDDPVGLENTKYPSIWEAVYLMGWAWSLVESVFSWHTVRPTSPEELRRFHDHPPPPFHNRLGAEEEDDGEEGEEDGEERNSPRRPLLGKRTRSDYSTILMSDDNTDEHDTARAEHRRFFTSIHHKRRDLGSPAYRDHTLQFSSMLCIEGSGSTTACDDSLRNSTSTPTNHGKAVDFEEEQQQQESESEDRQSNNDYGDDEDSSYSSSESSIRYSAPTPLLSSSLPYDPEQDHPHHEVPALHRQPSLSTICSGTGAATIMSTHSLLLPASSTASTTSSIVEIHEDDSLAPSATPSSPRRRQYPSFPSYSRTYNALHFPSSSSPHPASITAPSPPSTAIIRHHYHRRRVYGVTVDRLAAYLPVIWRASAMLRHIGHALWFAWAPALVFQQRFQWWCFFVVTVLAARKGWSMVEWFGGSASRAGLLRSSVVLLMFAVTVYVASLAVWGVFW